MLIQCLENEGISFSFPTIPMWEWTFSIETCALACWADWIIFCSYCLSGWLRCVVDERISIVSKNIEVRLSVKLVEGWVCKCQRRMIASWIDISCACSMVCARAGDSPIFQAEDYCAIQWRAYFHAGGPKWFLMHSVEFVKSINNL